MHTRFIMVRHGQTEWNLGDRFRGRADIALNDTGEDQARRASVALAADPIDAIYASPLNRTIRTTELVAGAHASIVPDSALMDIDYGDWQGWTKDEAAINRFEVRDGSYVIKTLNETSHLRTPAA